MATLADLSEFSALFGNSLTIKKINGQVVVTNRPKKTRSNPSPAEKAHQQKMGEAARYAKTVCKDPVIRALYKTGIKKKHDSAQSVAIADFHNAPEVKEIYVKDYRGAVGDPITVHALDDFQVTRVTVSILDVQGAEIESGDAVEIPGFNRWEYRATVANSTLKGSKIVAAAYDRPGNIGKGEALC